MKDNAQKATPEIIQKVTELESLRQAIIKCHSQLALKVNSNRNAVNITLIGNVSKSIPDIQKLLAIVSDYNAKKAVLVALAKTLDDKAYLNRALDAENPPSKSPTKRRYLSLLLQDIPRLQKALDDHNRQAAKLAYKQSPAPNKSLVLYSPDSASASGQASPDPNELFRASIRAAAAPKSPQAEPPNAALAASTVEQGASKEMHCTAVTPRSASAASAMQGGSASATQTKLSQPLINLDEQKKKFNELLDMLSMLNQKLDECQKNNKRYEVVAKAGSALSLTLTTARDDFFETRKLTYKEFKGVCTNSLKTMGDECSNHRGWHALNIVIRAFLGFLAIMTVIPALVVAKQSSHGFWGTFFKTPAPNSRVILGALAAEFDQVDQSLPPEIKTVAEVKAN